MSEQKHSPEPWRLSANHSAHIHANPEKTRRSPPVAICDLTHGLGDAALNDEANARRIVACVNALASIPTEELEAGIVGEMVEALQNGRSFARLFHDDAATTCIEQIDAILARLGRQS